MDPGYFPAHDTYIALMRASGKAAVLRHEYADPARAGLLTPCFATMVGPSGARLATLLELEHRDGPNPCTSYFVAAVGQGRAPPEQWLPISLRAARRAIEAYPEYGMAWVNLGNILRALNRLAAAETEVRRGIELVPDPGQRVRLYRMLATILGEQGDSVGGRVVRQALGSALLRGGPLSYTLGHLYALSQAAPREPGAFDLMYREVRLAAGSAALEKEWSARYRLAYALVDVGRPAEALEQYRYLAPITEKLGEDTLRLKLRVRRGRAYATLGRLDDAARDLEEAVALATRLDSGLELADAYHNLAHVHEAAQRMDLAADAIDRAIEVARTEAPDGSIRMITLRDAGVIGWKAGRHAAAHRAFREMIDVIERQQDNYSWAGEYLERIGDWRGAIHYYRLGLAADPDERALNLAGLARGYEALGLTDSASAAAREHDRAITNPWGVPLVPELLARQGRMEEAIASARAWVEERERGGHVEGTANAWLHLADLHLRAGQPTRALAAAEKAGGYADRVALTQARIRSLRILGEAHRALGRETSGVGLLRSAAELARAHPTLEDILATHLSLGTALAETAPAEAIAALDRAASEVERTTERMALDLDRVRYRHGHLAPFDLALRVLLGAPEMPDRLERTVEWSQRRKAAGLSLAARSALRADAGAAQPDGPRTIAQLQARLAPGDAVLSFTVLDDVAAVTFLSGDSVVLRHLPGDPEELARLTERLRRPFRDTFSGRLDLARAPFDIGAAHALHERLLAPVASLVTSARRLFIVPDGVLHRVPFGALVPVAGDAASPSAGFQDIPFVLDRQPIIYLPSLGFLPGPEDLRRLGAEVETILAVGGEAPGVGEEIAAIRRTWRRGPVLALEGPAATETAVAAAQEGIDILHIAAHARSGPDGSHLSYLELAPDEDHDGAWTLDEITAQSRRARLVVLSACETLEGPLFGGEGLMGLARAFLATGAEVVAATHWPVGETAAGLMEDFYGRLGGGSDPATALHEARLRLRADPRTEHPFFWAGFVLVAGP